MAVYYVDFTTGDDGDSGLTEALAWKTIAKVNAHTFAGDDSCLFKCGETWRERLDPNGVGSAGHQITYDAYSTGAKPKILGSTAVSTWTDQTGNHWSATLAALPAVVWFVAPTTGTVTWGVKKTYSNLSELTAEYQWCYNGTTLYVYAATTPGTRYASVEASARNDGVRAVGGSNYLTVQNLEIGFCGERGINFDSSTGCIANGNTIHHCGAKMAGTGLAAGICLTGTSNIARYNTVYETGIHGIELMTTCVNNLIEYNIVYNSYHSLIDFQNINGTFSGAICRYNLLYCDATYDNVLECGGINIGENSGGASVSYLQVYYNVIYDIPGPGISLYGAIDHLSLYNNVIVGTHSGYAGYSTAINVAQDTAASATIKNNIGMNFASGCFYIKGVNRLTACDNNLWYQAAGGTAIYAAIEDVASYHYNDLSAYKTAMGGTMEQHTLWQDPLFVNAVAYDFNLQAGSPCINAGANVGLTGDFEGHPIV